MEDFIAQSKNGSPSNSGEQEAPAAGRDSDEAVRAGVEQIAQEFDASLLDDPSLSAEQRREISQLFNSALQEQLESADKTPSLPDRRQWTDTIESLQRSGLLDDNDAADIIRQLDTAFSQFEQHETRLAIEFGRRMQADGEERALEWFREQQASAKTGKDDGSVPSNDSLHARPLRNDVVKSRSRRLRGPPKS